jgi:DNA-binding HxlR family transcriptional regulator
MRLDDRHGVNLRRELYKIKYLVELRLERTMFGMRSYGQYCSLARGLDLIGDRWTLLIVRELAIRPCRYSDLRDGLPGVATNLLADRLREMIDAGLATKVDAPPPVGTAVYELTEFGRGLVPIMLQLTDWATPLMYQGPAENDAFRTRWLVLAVPSILGAEVGEGLEQRVRFVVGDDEPADLVVADGHPTVELNSTTAADLVINADAHITMGLLAGAVSLAEAANAGEVRGTQRAKRQFAKLVNVGLGRRRPAPA